MAGIYLHIPFCKKACHYCDFHFSTNSSMMTELIHLMGEELILRKDYLPKHEVIQTIYFGGGTPSLLSAEQVRYLLDIVHEHYPVQLGEVTLEANPDDLTAKKLDDYRAIGVDRLSIGIQSFRDEVLTFYNRAHTSEESLQVLNLARKAGFEKLSIDLIYGYPEKDHSGWKSDLETALNLDPGHISSYALTVEPKTALGNWVKKGTFQPASEDFVAEEFEILQEAMDARGYVQYEISNFGKPDAFALHNTNYWRGVPYLGIGPSAHSYDGTNRGRNRAHNSAYITQLRERQLVFTIENLSEVDRINEYLLTSLRTIWGVDTIFLFQKYGVDLLVEKVKELEFLQASGWIYVRDSRLYLTRQGMLLADGISEKLFL